MKWQISEETQLENLVKSVDILILNHGVNVHGQRTPEAMELAYQVNTFFRLAFNGIILQNYPLLPMHH